MGSPFGKIEVRGARENNLMPYTWAGYGLESVVAWPLTASSTGTHLHMEQVGLQAGSAVINGAQINHERCHQTFDSSLDSHHL